MLSPSARPQLSAWAPLLLACAFVAMCVHAPSGVQGQIGYTRHLSDLHKEELHNMAVRMQQSINPEKYACENFYDYVCSLNRPLYSIMGHQPNATVILTLLKELQNDPTQFEAKQKLMDFYISCSTLKAVEDCYREAFAYFRPVFGYIITKNHIDRASHEHHIFLELLQRFLRNSEHMKHSQQSHIRNQLLKLRDKFDRPQLYFKADELTREFQSLPIYREGYQHNLRNLELHRKRNSTYEMGLQRTMLDWSLYVYQSKNKPMSYYYPTFNVHLWMTLYNSTERMRDFKSSQQIAECLKLSQSVNVLNEARVLAMVYLMSFGSAWKEYNDWINSSITHQAIYDQENVILKGFHLNNKRIFFTLYAQNFCEFGKEIAENVFYLGLNRNQEFYDIYSCGYQTEVGNNCVQ